MADTWTLAPVIARRAAEHPERPLVIGVPRRLSSPRGEVQAFAFAAVRSECGISEDQRIGIDLPDCAEEAETRPAVFPRRSTDADARARGIAGRRTELVRRGYQLQRRAVADSRRADPATDGGCDAASDGPGARTGAGVVPREDAGTTGGEAQAFARDTMADSTSPDLDRLFDVFPMTGSGKARCRELERVVALDSTVTSGA